MSAVIGAAISVLLPLAEELAKYLERGAEGDRPEFLASIPNPLKSEVAIKLRRAERDARKAAQKKEP